MAEARTCETRTTRELVIGLEKHAAIVKVTNKYKITKWRLYGRFTLDMFITNEILEMGMENVVQRT